MKIEKETLENVKQQKYIVGIGATNVDVYGKSRIRLRTHYDHPADISSSVGGVMYNIICNYVKLGGSAKLITAIGDDIYGSSIIDECQKQKIDISDSLSAKGSSSGIFMQIQDENNDMYLAICDMSILDYLTPEYIHKKEELIVNASIVVIDPSLRNDSIETIIQICQDKVPIYIDPISDHYALKIKEYIPYFDLIKPNRSELENLSGMKIESIEDAIKAGKLLLDQGLNKIVISMSEEGIIYMEGDTIIHRKLEAEKEIVNASGAGDALLSGIIYGNMSDYEIEKTIDLGLASGIAALRSKHTINENMSIDLLEKILKEKKR